jgi:hypothetical protein
VLTAYEDGASELEDSELLNRAGGVGRVLFTRDDDSGNKKGCSG